MTGALVADLGGIEAFADALTQVQTTFDDGVNTSATFQVDAGQPVLDALNDFNNRWSAGRAVIDSCFVALTGMCHASAAQLRATDAALAAQTKPSTAHSLGGRALTD